VARPPQQSQAVIRRGFQRPEDEQLRSGMDDGVTFFRYACHMGLEGIVSKRLSAPYRSGPSRVWLKVKNPDSPSWFGRERSSGEDAPAGKLCAGIPGWDRSVCSTREVLGQA
jgi:hypothetical protein